MSSKPKMETKLYGTPTVVYLDIKAYGLLFGRHKRSLVFFNEKLDSKIVEGNFIEIVEVTDLTSLTRTHAPSITVQITSIESYINGYTNNVGIWLVHIRFEEEI